MKDIFVDLGRNVESDGERIDKLQVVGMLHFGKRKLFPLCGIRRLLAYRYANTLGLHVQLVRMWRAGGSVLVYKRDRLWELSDEFSVAGIKTLLKFLAVVWQMQVSLHLYSLLLFHLVSAFDVLAGRLSFFPCRRSYGTT